MRSSEPCHKNKVEGARRVWGTFSVCIYCCSAIHHTIKKNCVALILYESRGKQKNWQMERCAGCLCFTTKRLSFKLLMQNGSRLSSKQRGN